MLERISIIRSWPQADYCFSHTNSDNKKMMTQYKFYLPTSRRWYENKSVKEQDKWCMETIYAWDFYILVLVNTIICDTSNWHCSCRHKKQIQNERQQWLNIQQRCMTTLCLITLTTKKNEKCILKRNEWEGQCLNGDFTFFAIKSKTVGIFFFSSLFETEPYLP